MNKILEVKNLDKHFPVLGGVLRRPVGHVYAVNDVSFSIDAGETLGIVGESGCGKSTLGRCIVRLYDPTRGEVFFKGKNMVDLDTSGLKQVRRDMQMIFQDPYASLNPRMSIRSILEEPFELHKIGTSKDRRERVAELLKQVGMRPEGMFRYPHEFSGGQRQRISIARAIALNPELIICDEPVSALDVSVQSQVLNLLVNLQKKLNLTYIFISHDLTVVKYISDRIAVMYLGKIVEIAEEDELFARTLHPYTQGLLASLPIPDPRKRKEMRIMEGDVPSPRQLPSGCLFHPRCKYCEDRCRVEVPEFRNLGSEGKNEHRVACHFAEKIQEIIRSKKNE